MTKKITNVKACYKDDTHRRMERHIAIDIELIQKFKKEGNEELAKFVRLRTEGAIDALYFAGCVNSDRKRYLESLLR